MAFCTNCGRELAEGAKFCENCGTPVAVETVTETAIVEAEPAFEESTPVETPVYVAAAPQNTPEQASAAKSALIFSIIGLALAEMGLPGIILSAIARGKVKKAQALGAIGGKVKTANILSLIGLIASIVMTVVWVIYIIVMIALVVGLAYGAYNGYYDSMLNVLSLM